MCIIDDEDDDEEEKEQENTLREEFTELPTCGLSRVDSTGATNVVLCAIDAADATVERAAVRPIRWCVHDRSISLQCCVAMSVARLSSQTLFL